MIRMKIPSENTESSAGGGLAGKSAFKAMLAADRQEAFQSILNNTQSDGNRQGNFAGDGKNVPMRDLIPGNPLTAAAGEDSPASAAGIASRVRSNAMSVVNEGGFDNLAASALLKAASLTSSASPSLDLYNMKGMGGGSNPAMASTYTAAYENAASVGGVRRRSYGSGYASSGASSAPTGVVSAQFESGGDSGVDAIGYDSNGGTSYGTYQISSRQGTMKAFLDYLDDSAPDISSKLRSAGSSNTGGRTGRMPSMWKKVADEQPERFGELQRDFIEQSHYLPAVQALQDSASFDVTTRSKALQEAMWSTAVQHGPDKAARIFTKAIEKAARSGGGVSDSKIIENVYALRSGDFGSSSASVQSAVKGRFNDEKEMLLTMLAREPKEV